MSLAVTISGFGIAGILLLFLLSKQKKIGKLLNEIQNLNFKIEDLKYQFKMADKLNEERKSQIERLLSGDRLNFIQLPGEDTAADKPAGP